MYDAPYCVGFKWNTNIQKQMVWHKSGFHVNAIKHEAIYTTVSFMTSYRKAAVLSILLFISIIRFFFSLNQLPLSWNMSYPKEKDNY